MSAIWHWTTVIRPAPTLWGRSLAAAILPATASMPMAIPAMVRFLSLPSLSEMGGGLDYLAKCAVFQLLLLLCMWCADIDECTESRSLCEQNCINTPGSYICTCNPGYSLLNNRISCAGQCSMHASHYTPEGVYVT